MSTKAPVPSMRSLFASSVQRGRRLVAHCLETDLIGLEELCEAFAQLRDATDAQYGFAFSRAANLFTTQRRLMWLRLTFDWFKSASQGSARSHLTPRGVGIV